MLPCRDDEGAEAEGQETRRPRKGPFGKEDKHPPSLCSLKRPAHVLDASFGISTVDEERSQLPQEGAGKELRFKLLFWQ